MNDIRYASASGIIAAIAVFLNVIVFKSAFTINEEWYWALLVTIPLLLVAVSDIKRNKYNYRNKRTSRNTKATLDWKD